MKLDMVGIIVKDMKKAITFYETLGFSTLGEFGEDYSELDNQGVRISLNTHQMIESIYGFSPESTGDKLELAFLCNSPQEVDDLHQKMKLAGYEIFKDPWDAFWGQHYCIIKDLEGNLLSLFANLEEVK